MGAEEQIQPPQKDKRQQSMVKLWAAVCAVPVRWAAFGRIFIVCLDCLLLVNATLPPRSLPPRPNDQHPPATRAAAEDTPGAAAARRQGSVIQRPPAGRCGELERLLSLSPPTEQIPHWDPDHRWQGS